MFVAPPCRYKKCGPTRDGHVFPPGTTRDFAQSTQPFDCAFLLMNGVYQPEIAMKTGVWQRWRFVQSSHASMLRMSIPHGCEMAVLAMDGAYLDAPTSLVDKQLVLAAGARADLAVRCSAAGRYNVSSLPGGFHTRSSTVSKEIVELYEPVVYPRTIAALVVADTAEKGPAAGPLPSSLPPRPAAMQDLSGAKVDETFHIVYNLTGPGAEGGLEELANGGQFAINGLSYTGRTEHCMTLGSIQEWTIENARNPLERWMHSFHVHVNNFQVMSTDAGVPGQLILDEQVADWRDTVVIPAGGKVVIRMNVTDFTGRFPFHCHVTAHQDIGMMQMVEVNRSCK